MGCCNFGINQALAFLLVNLLIKLSINTFLLFCKLCINISSICLSCQKAIHFFLVSLLVKFGIKGLLAHYFFCTHTKFLRHLKKRRSSPRCAIVRIKYINALSKLQTAKTAICSSSLGKVIHLHTCYFLRYGTYTCHAHIRSTLKQFQLVDDASYQLIPVAIPLSVHAPSSSVRIPVMRPTINSHVVTFHASRRKLLVHLVDTTKLPLVVRTCFVYIISHILLNL